MRRGVRRESNRPPPFPILSFLCTAGLTANPWVDREDEQSLSGFLTPSVTKGTFAGYTREWNKWLIFLLDRDITDPYLTACPETDKSKLLCCLFRARYLQGEGKGAHGIGSTVRVYFEINMSPTGFLDHPMVSPFPPLSGDPWRINYVKVVVLYQIAFVQQGLFAPEILSIVTRETFLVWAWAFIDGRLGQFYQRPFFESNPPHNPTGDYPDYDTYLLRAYPCNRDFEFWHKPNVLLCLRCPLRLTPQDIEEAYI
jgi:hypothetical protein